MEATYTRLSYYDAGKLSAMQFFFEVQADTAERRNPVTRELDLVLGHTASYFRAAAALAGLQSLTLQGK